ncbi:hypothetical protein FLAG1_08769 [Fusarium langsethiae]|uniref:Uncharacterized protein n=1 Tax=Fusarium langsethiae TaxID=179993 RepID=A0A0N0DCM4_FUSLA|nr:hypothetical protein FLAG1_08769 [Fusarium langsethiae]GKU05591.1 unnamed protein product [Fusarium langsethiae]GKU21756.1 unnamed protein product [Fusarium langsethiae]
MSTTSGTIPTFYVDGAIQNSRVPRNNYTWHVEQDISDIFAALDELSLDLDPFNYHKPAKECYYASKPLPPLPALPSSTCFDSTRSDTSSTSSASFLFASGQEYKQIKAYDKSLRPQDVVRETVQQKVNSWLSQLPFRPEVAETYRKQAMHSWRKWPTKHKRHQKSEPLIIISSPRMSDDTTIAAIDDSKTQTGDTDSIKALGKRHIGHDRRNSLDSYHSALLHMQKPFENYNSKFCPTLRRKYPRGLEDEARLGIGVAFVTAEGGA